MGKLGCQLVLSQALISIYSYCKVGLIPGLITSDRFWRRLSDLQLKTLDQMSDSDKCFWSDHTLPSVQLHFSGFIDDVPAANLAIYNWGEKLCPIFDLALAQCRVESWPCYCCAVRCLRIAKNRLVWPQKKCLTRSSISCRSMKHRTMHSLEYEQDVCWDQDCSFRWNCLLYAIKASHGQKLEHWTEEQSRIGIECRKGRCRGLGNRIGMGVHLDCNINPIPDTAIDPSVWALT